MPKGSEVVTADAMEVEDGNRLSTSNRHHAHTARSVMLFYTFRAEVVTHAATRQARHDCAVSVYDAVVFMTMLCEQLEGMAALQPEPATGVNPCCA